MKVIFSHGKESGPWGTKIQCLAKVAEQAGCDVESVDYQNMDDPDLRVAKLVRLLEDEEDAVLLVGSSMGGYVSIVATEAVAVQGVFKYCQLTDF